MTLATLSLVIIREEFLVFPREAEKLRRLIGYMLIDDQSSGSDDAAVRESNQLLAPEPWYGHARLVVLPIESHSRVEAVPIHALGYELQIVYQPHELRLRRSYERQRLGVQMITQQRRDSQKRQTESLNLMKKNVLLKSFFH